MRLSIKASIAILRVSIVPLVVTVSLFAVFALIPAIGRAQQAQQSLPVPQVMPLYPDSIPNSKPAPDEETGPDKAGIIAKVSRPTLTVFLPPAAIANGTAVIICPGGGYWILASWHEGADVARKFNEWGVAAFVLKYRIPNSATMVNREIGPLQDAQQAIKVVRQHAQAWHINASRVGIMGFSAGGHVASTAGTHFNTVVIPDPEKISVRPDFMILGYPVISFQDSFGHLGSRNQLIGKNPPRKKIDWYSNELQVTDRTPPAFLVHASNDNGVNPENSIRFYQALLKHHIPAELHLYQSGGHGFGMNLPNKEEFWMDRCKHWMQVNGWVPRGK